MKKGFKIKTEDTYATVMMSVGGMQDTTIVAQLLDTSDKVVKQTTSNDGNVEFFYVNPGTYYMRMFVDSNRNGIWDTGEYAGKKQAETTYYYPEKIECRAKWDLNLSWNPESTPLYLQKPLAITRQKPEKDKTIRRRNAERASKLGIPYPQP